MCHEHVLVLALRRVLLLPILLELLIDTQEEILEFLIAQEF